MSLRVRDKLSKPGNKEKKGRNKERERTRRGTARGSTGRAERGERESNRKSGA